VVRFLCYHPLSKPQLPSPELTVTRMSTFCHVRRLENVEQGKDVPQYKSEIKTPLSQRARHKWESGLTKLAGAVTHLDRSRSEIALTFDDGPDPRFTPPLLDELAKAGVSASFFWTGQTVKVHPELAREVRSAGHSIGSHSFSHMPPAGHSFSEIRADFLRGQRTVEDIIGESTRLFRPPYGAITAKSVRAMRELHLNPVLWSIGTADWRDGVTSDRILESIAHVSAGDVILMHDGAEDAGPGIGTDRWATINAIRQLIEMISERGLSFVSLNGR
jgi:peptidoglycan/xylan/chitin deacetylase (PgdA/CDA1 family)